MYYVEFNNINNSDMGIYATRPNIPAAKRKKTSYKIPGRDGELYIHENAVEDIVISIDFGFYCEQSKWMDYYRAAKKWLLTKMSGKLILSDDTDYFYKVKSVAIGTAERIVKDIGEFKADFTCDGFQYLKSGLFEYDKEDVLYNPYSLSKPIYKITGEGVCQLIVNGKTVSANVGQNITIDTERMISHRSDGTLQNTNISGDYEDLYLSEGDNTISISEGFALKVIPNWRCL